MIDVSGWAVTAPGVDRAFTSAVEAEQAAVTALTAGLTVRIDRYWADGLVEHCRIIIIGTKPKATPWQVYVKQPARRYL